MWRLEGTKELQLMIFLTSRKRNNAILASTQVTDTSLEEQAKQTVPIPSQQFLKTGQHAAPSATAATYPPQVLPSLHSPQDSDFKAPDQNVHHLLSQHLEYLSLKGTDTHPKCNPHGWILST